MIDKIMDFLIETQKEHDRKTLILEAFEDLVYMVDMLTDSDIEKQDYEEVYNKTQTLLKLDADGKILEYTIHMYDDIDRRYKGQ